MRRVDPFRLIRRCTVGPCAIRAICVRGLMAVCLIAVGGCAPGDPSVALMEDYRARVLRTLGAPASKLSLPQITPWPRHRDRHLTVPEGRIDLIDFLRLQECGLGALMGERSSSLGRVMQAPERLRYEIRFVAAARGCRTRLDPVEDEASIALLDEVLALKREQMAHVVWNATLGSDALARHHELDVAGIDPDLAGGVGAEATGALYAIAVRVGADPFEGAERREASADDLSRAGRDAFFDPWAVLDADRFGARLRRSLAVLTAYLENVADGLEAAGPWCPLGRITERARILETVFRVRYVDRVQPYLAAVDGAGARWIDALTALRRVQIVTAPALAVVPTELELQRMRRARDRHTRIWQDVLGACGLAPRDARAD